MSLRRKRRLGRLYRTSTGHGELAGPLVRFAAKSGAELRFGKAGALPESCYEASKVYRKLLHGSECRRKAIW